MRRAIALVTLLLAAAGSVAAAPAGSDQADPGLDREQRRQLAEVRHAVADLRDVEAAVAAGYAELLDADGIACIAHADLGAMGVHYVQGDLVGDAVVDPLQPEAVIYEPGPRGRLRPVGVEYVVFQEAWDAVNAAPPELFDQPFTLVGAGNRYGLPAFYQLHAWIWRHNPTGMFSDYNPRVRCPCDHAGHG